MYRRYFGLKRAPFSIAPDPRYLYMSPQHREALAHLLYGIKSEGGFVLLTGEVGAGKTTICRRILETLSKNIVVAFIINPTVSVGELLAAVCDEFGIVYPRKTSIKDLVDRINGFLLDLNARRKKAILIIDEAQNLKDEVLEQIRLLTNLETNERKLLQIILIGQPELRERLCRPELKQLSQRIVARCHIDALSKPDVIRYVNHRIAVARGMRSGAGNSGRTNPRRTSAEAKSGGGGTAKEGASAVDQGSPAPKLPAPRPTVPPALQSAAVPAADSALFSKSALNCLYNCSGGIPRLINLICDRALLGAFVQHKQVIDRATMIKAAGEVLGRRPAEAAQKWKIGLAAAALICAWLGFLYVFFNGFTLPGRLSAGKFWRIRQAQSNRDSAPGKPESNPAIKARPTWSGPPAPLRDAGAGNGSGVDRAPQAKQSPQPQS
jgi:type II secretory pathway predicted ATPase ExeA